MDLNNGSGVGGGAMACPVCTLYLREGISLQKHLDTHPKEQVIEALIKASGSLPQIQQPSTPLPAPTLSPNVPQGSHSLQSSPPASQITQSSQVSPPSPYPIGPIFECPPISTTMMPPQFASFSYQQFVNNGTMMIPQYAMAPPQANQMLQMLYNPYSVYQQQQIPTVQMISPVTTIPTTNRLQRPMVSVASGETSNKATVCTVSESESKEILPETVSELSTEPERIENTIQPASPSSLPAMENNSIAEQDQPLNDNSAHIEYRGLGRNSPSEETSAHQVACTKVSDSLTVSINCIEGNIGETVLPGIEDVEVPSSMSLPLHIRPVKSPSNYEHESKSSKFVDTYRDEQGDGLIECEGDQIEKASENSNNAETSSSDIEVDKSAECRSLVTETDKDCGQPEVEQLEHFLVTMMESEMSNQHKIWKEDKEVAQKPISSREESDICNDVSQEKCTLPDIDTTVAEESETSIKSKLQIDDTNSNCLYHYKHSLSAPTSPVSRKSQFRTFSVHSEFGSHDNLDAYVDGFDGMIIMQNEDDEDEKHDHTEEIDMEIEQIPSPHTPPLRYDESVASHVRSHTPLSAISGISVLKVRNDLSKPSSPASVHSFSQIEPDNGMVCCAEDSNDMLDVRSKHNLADSTEVPEKEVNLSQNRDAQTSASDLEKKSETNHGYHESIISGHVTSFPLHSQHQAYQQQQQQITVAHESYSLSSNKSILNLSEPVDSTTDPESKNFSSSKSITQQKQSLEILNISEDAHAGPMNVLEFDGLQILVPSTFISESSQKAVSASSQQSAASSESAGIDEEVKSINMRADETMPARGELSEQESNGCTEQSAWQLYMGHQESSRMSTSYDLMARESWEESEGSDNEIGGPLLDSRSLATHFTSSLFLDRDRKTPTKRTFKCSHCSEVFDCPKERRVHSTTVHKEAGPSSSGDRMDQSEVKDIKLLDGRMNVFEDIFVPGLHVQQVYQQQNYHQQQQQQQQQSQPLLHQLQPPAAPTSNLGKIDSDRKLENLTIPSNVEVICMICNQPFASEKSLQIHHRRMHVNEVPKRVRESAKCQVCNEEFPSVVSFNAHLKIHPLECGQCGKYFYRKQNFKLHLKRHLGIKPFPCTVCDKAFLTKQKLDEHTNGHTGNAPVKCNLCNETFRRYSNLTQHKNRHHLNIKKKLKDYVCHCGEVFHTKKKLAWHKETHDEKPKACTYCNERFIHMASLTRHMRRAHNRRFVPDAQRESENVECPICKCIYLRSSLAVHMRVHNGERPYECQVCSKAFSTKWNLQLHKWTHAARSTKPFKCNQCSAAFYRHSDYTAHMNSHRNVRPYTCNYCGAQFIRKYNCLRHVKEHEENKAYTCDVCNKTFHRSYYLKEHLRVHSGARPYTCHICGKSSGTKSNHNKHVRIHHAREPVNTEN